MNPMDAFQPYALMRSILFVCVPMAHACVSAEGTNNTRPHQAVPQIVRQSIDIRFALRMMTGLCGRFCASSKRISNLRNA